MLRAFAALALINVALTIVAAAMTAGFGTVVPGRRVRRSRAGTVLVGALVVGSMILGAFVALGAAFWMQRNNPGPWHFAGGILALLAIVIASIAFACRKNALAYRLLFTPRG